MRKFKIFWVNIVKILKAGFLRRLWVSGFMELKVK